MAREEQEQPHHTTAQQQKRRKRWYDYSHIAVSALMVMGATLTLIEILVPAAALGLGITGIILVVISAILLYHNRHPVECYEHKADKKLYQPEREPLLEKQPAKQQKIERYTSAPADFWQDRLHKSSHHALPERGM